MTERRPSSASPVSLLQRIDDVCDKFEAQWRAGRRPDMERFLESIDESERPAVLEELLLIEWPWRLRHGETPTIAEYVLRFPKDRAQILQVAQRYADAIPSFAVETNTASQSTASQPTQAFAQADNAEPKTGTSAAVLDASTVVYAPTVSPFVASPGKPFGNYELLRVVAHGGMGVVYQARQAGVNRLVALKMILSGSVASAEERRRFLAEAEAAGKLRHPNIVPVFEVGELEGQPFFSMGYIDGPSLKSKLSDGPLPPRQAAELLRTITQAVAYAHSQDIIHRDLKPANILLDAEGQPQVTDFGLAKLTTTDSSLTASGQILGTPSYMPPEQALGNVSQVGVTADVYSLGATLYCMLIGRPPFQAATVVETLQQVVHQDPVPPRQLNREIPRDLEIICLKCLQKAPWQRYSTADRLADDLDRFLTNRTIFARPVGVGERTVKWCRRNPLVSLLGVATVVAVAATTIYQITRPAFMSLSVAPATARFRIAGREFSPVDGTLQLNLPPGRVVVEASAEGYAIDRRELVLSRGRSNEQRVSFALEAQVGHVQIDSDPPQADVRMIDKDGRTVATGITPFHSKSLPSAEYRLEVSKPLFQTVATTVSVPTGNRVVELPAAQLKAAFKHADSYERLRARREALQRRLQKPVAFNRVPLKDALSRLAENEGVKILVNETALKDQKLDVHLPATAEIADGTLEEALDALLEPLHLTYLPQAAAPQLTLQVTTPFEESINFETVLFSVVDMVPSDQGQLDFRSLIGLIRSSGDARWEDEDELGGTVAAVPAYQALQVRQTWQSLVEIDKLLNDQRALRIAQPTNRQETPPSLSVDSTAGSSRDAVLFSNWQSLPGLVDSAPWLRQPASASSWTMDHAVIVGAPMKVTERLLLTSGWLTDFEFEAQVRVTGRAQLLLLTPGGWDVTAGYVCPLLAKAAPPTGLISGWKAAQPDPPPSEWYSVSIRVMKGDFEVRINDKVVTRGQDPYGNRFTTGYLGFEVPPGNRCEVRKARLRNTLPSSAAKDPVALTQSPMAYLLDADLSTTDRWLQQSVRGNFRRLAAVSVRDTRAGPRFDMAALRDGDQRPWVIATNQTFADDYARYRTMAEIGGWRPLTRQSYRFGDELRSMNLFHRYGEPVGNWFFWRFPDWNTFQRQMQQHRQQGHRVVEAHFASAAASRPALESDGTPTAEGRTPTFSEVTFMGRSSPLEWEYVGPLTADECQQRARVALAARRFIEHVHIIPSPSGPLFGLIVVANPWEIPNRFDMGLTKAQFQQAGEVLQHQGLCPQSLAAYEVGGELRYAVSWQPFRYHAESSSTHRQP